MKNKIKQKAKKLLKQQKKTRLIKKRIEKYTCKRCKIKFDNNIKFHEHIRIRHAKKSKSQSIVSFFTSSESIIFLFFSLSKSVIALLIIFFFRIFVDCNIKKIDILSENNFTISRCIEIFSFFDCDIEIDLQILEKCKRYLLVYFVSNVYIIEILFDRERSVSHVR